MNLEFDPPIVQRLLRCVQIGGNRKTRQEWNCWRGLTGEEGLKMIRADDDNPRRAKVYDTQVAAFLQVAARVESVSVRDTVRIVNANDDPGDGSGAVRVLHIVWLQHEFGCLMLRDLEQRLRITARRKRKSPRPHHLRAVQSINQAAKWSNIRGR